MQEIGHACDNAVDCYRRKTVEIYVVNCINIFYNQTQIEIEIEIVITSRTRCLLGFFIACFLHCLFR